LCPHDQVWAREACGDVWLGLDPEDISLWASTVGLVEGQNLYFAQRNGFSVQLRQFIKPN
jgi:ArsR family transcriptional regulator